MHICKSFNPLWIIGSYSAKALRKRNITRVLHLISPPNHLRNIESGHFWTLYFRPKAGRHAEQYVYVANFCRCETDVGNKNKSRWIVPLRKFFSLVHGFSLWSWPCCLEVFNLVSLCASPHPLPHHSASALKKSLGCYTELGIDKTDFQRQPIPTSNNRYLTTSNQQQWQSTWTFNNRYRNPTHNNQQTTIMNDRKSRCTL